ncbi:MAG: hypothetical protein EA369_07085 [Bradymonadales bacterium]|nr:MAG: hypothetical protein EA369_07085 [Bradymonadales bacterium]
MSILKVFEESMEGRSRGWRSLLLLWSAWIAYHVFIDQNPSITRNPFFFFDHGIHEIGHWVTRPFGMWVSVASGTIFQVLFPFVPIIALLRQNDIHGAFFLLTWVSSCLLNVAFYAGSAAYSDLLLWTPHRLTIYHDWVWMLSQLQALHWAPAIKNFFYALSVIALCTSIAGQILLLCLKKSD